jgi:hypothetical protein
MIDNHEPRFSVKEVTEALGEEVLFLGRGAFGTHGEQVIPQ